MCLSKILLEFAQRNFRSSLRNNLSICVVQISGRFIQYYNAYSTVDWECLWEGRVRYSWRINSLCKVIHLPDTSTYTQMDLHVVTTIKMSPAKGDANLSNKMRHKFNLCSHTNLGDLEITGSVLLHTQVPGAIKKSHSSF